MEFCYVYSQWIQFHGSAIEIGYENQCDVYYRLCVGVFEKNLFFWGEGHPVRAALSKRRRALCSVKYHQGS